MFQDDIVEHNQIRSMQHETIKRFQFALEKVNQIMISAE